MAPTPALPIRWIRGVKRRWCEVDFLTFLVPRFRTNGAVPPLLPHAPWHALRQFAVYVSWALGVYPHITRSSAQSTVEPRFTNAPVHEQFGSRTNFPRKTSWMTNGVSDYEHASWEYRRGSVSCWLTNLVSVYEHFGSRTASRNELNSWTEVPLYVSDACFVLVNWSFAHLFRVGKRNRLWDCFLIWDTPVVAKLSAEIWW
jgi:hypothetical protein